MMVSSEKHVAGSVTVGVCFPIVTPGSTECIKGMLKSEGFML